MEAGTVSDAVVEGLPSGLKWYDGDMDNDGKKLLVASGPDVPSYTIDVVVRAATAGNRPGSGRWDDFAHHPKDGRLISVEGDNGDLLHVDPRKNPMKTVLQKQVFPPAEASGSSGSRKSYSATFFDSDGHFYAVDSAGNVNHLDLSGSTVPDRAERIGKGKIPVDGLEVVNGAGRITPMPIPPSYDEILVAKKARGSWQSSDPQGKVYSVELTITAAKAGGEGKETRKFRISFDLRTAPGARWWHPASTSRTRTARCTSTPRRISC
ncbi:hypothetical protein [Streptomyces sp. cmx-18-6]|uniref:hypothetical protein n=1 Tax=Streptomyces sp. cmx-18-6 TaxID=2790930 RepID=UPI00397F3D67